MKCSDCEKSAVCKWNAALEAIFTPKDDTTGFPFKDSGRTGRKNPFFHNRTVDGKCHTNPSLKTDCH